MYCMYLRFELVWDRLEGDEVRPRACQHLWKFLSASFVTDLPESPLRKQQEMIEPALQISFDTSYS